MSRSVAIAAGKDVVRCGLSPLESEDEVEERVDERIWVPDFLPYRLRAR